MLLRLLLPAVLGLSLLAQNTGPSYTDAGVVNGASLLPGPLAPNTWATLNGTNLSWSTAKAGLEEVTAGRWPTTIAGTGVQILLSGGTPAHLSMVSPTQINFLTPASRIPGPATLTVIRDGIMGSSVTITFNDVAPGLFQTDSIVQATHADGSAVNNDSPARPGEVVSVFGTGFGQTATPLDAMSDGVIVTSTDQKGRTLARLADLVVTLDDSPLDGSLVQWAGLSLGSAGVYQVNFQVPDNVGTNPQIRIWIGDQGSQPGVALAVQPQSPQED